MGPWGVPGWHVLVFALGAFVAALFLFVYVRAGGARHPAFASYFMFAVLVLAGINLCLVFWFRNHRW